MSSLVDKVHEYLTISNVGIILTYVPVLASHHFMQMWDMYIFGNVFVSCILRIPTSEGIECSSRYLHV